MSAEVTGKVGGTNMKYCPRCKTRVADSLARCDKCGGEVRRFGAPPTPSAAPAGAPLTSPNPTPPTPTQSTPAAPAPAPVASPAATSGANTGFSPGPMALPVTSTSAAVPTNSVQPPATTEATPVTASPVESGDVGQLRLQLAGLQHEVARTRRHVYVAGAIVALLLVGLGLWLYELKASAIRAFATLDAVALEAVPGNPLAAMVNFRPTSQGKIEIIRRDGDQTETLIEHFDASVANTLEARRFTWRGADRNYTILFRYRDNGRIREQAFGPPSAPVDLGKGERF